MILHKQAKSPRACFILPLSAPLFDAGALETAVYVGPASVQWWTDHIDAREGRDALEPPAPAQAQGQGRAHLHDSPCAHWRMAYDGVRVELCLHPTTGVPLLIHHPFIRAHVLDWTVPDHLQTATPAPAPASPAASASAAEQAAWRLERELRGDEPEPEPEQPSPPPASSPPLAFSSALFDPERASVARCAPFGTPTRKQQ
jgi:hypothetical protein